MTSGRLGIWSILSSVVWVLGCGGRAGDGAEGPITPSRSGVSEVAAEGRPSSELVPDPRWELRTLEGTRVTLGSHRGRPVLVNLWATWCPPCVEELASLDRLARRVADTEVAFLLVTPEEAGPVREFLARRPLSLPVYLEGTLAPAAFGPLVLPTTFILDAAGVIRLRHRGASAWDTPEVEALLRRLAQEGAP